MYNSYRRLPHGLFEVWFLKDAEVNTNSSVIFRINIQHL